MGEWKTVRLDEYADTDSGGTPSRTVVDYFGGDVPWVTTSELKDTFIDQTNECITTKGLNHSSAKLFPKGTLLMAMYGATIGKLGILNIDAATNQACCAFFCKPTLDSKYLYYRLLSMRNTLIALGSGAGQPNISQAIIKGLHFLLPDIDEQRRIATVLSVADEAIAASHALVEKYASVKKGLMLDLLSGRVRLAGFKDEWEPLKIGNLLEFKNGLNKGKEFFGEGVPIVNYMDVYSRSRIHAESLEGRVCLSKDEIKRFEVRKGDVFFTRTSETVNEVGYASVLLDEVKDGVFSGFVLRGRPKNDKLDILYCQYCFATPEIRRSIIIGATYTTRALTSGTYLSTIPILLPKPDEQRAIAKVIMAADEQLTAEQEKFRKLVDIKRGLMDDLMTNRVSTDKQQGGVLDGKHQS